jgi:hypothetical protein
VLADGEAEICAVIAAVPALAALRREERNDVVAACDIGHALADALDDAGLRDRVWPGSSPRGRRPTRCTGRCGRRRTQQGHEDLTRFRLREVELLDLQRSAELLEHRGANLHVAILSTSDLVLLL